jgi:hypothetical protein
MRISFLCIGQLSLVQSFWCCCGSSCLSTTETRRCPRDVESAEFAPSEARRRAPGSLLQSLRRDAVENIIVLATAWFKFFVSSYYSESRTLWCPSVGMLVRMSREATNPVPFIACGSDKGCYSVSQSPAVQQLRAKAEGGDADAQNKVLSPSRSLCAFPSQPFPESTFHHALSGDIARAAR